MNKQHWIQIFIKTPQTLFCGILFFQKKNKFRPLPINPKYVICRLLHHKSKGKCNSPFHWLQRILKTNLMYFYSCNLRIKGMECFHIRNNQVWREKLFSLEIRCQRIDTMEVYKIMNWQKDGGNQGDRSKELKWIIKSRIYGKKPNPTICIIEA